MPINYVIDKMTGTEYDLVLYLRQLEDLIRNIKTNN